MIKVSQIKMHTDGGTVVLTPALQYVLLATPFYTYSLREKGKFVKRKKEKPAFLPVSRMFIQLRLP